MRSRINHGIRIPRGFAAALLFAASSAAAAQASRGPLTIGIVADANALPFVVAREEGLFAAEGAEVRLIRFASEADRDAALQAEAIDAATTDLVSLMLYSQAGLELRAAGMTDGRYGIVSSPRSGLASPSALEGASIAVSIGTIDQFVTEALLDRIGLGPGSYSTTPIFSAEERLASLLSGKIKAACLPEPFLSRAMSGGAVLLASTASLGLETGVLAFRKEALDASLETAAALYRAYRTAARMINENNAKYRSLLVGEAGFAPEIRDSFEFIVYKRPRLPTREELAAVAAWLADAGLMPRGLDPLTLLDGRALDRAFGGW